MTLEALQPISIASQISADATWDTTNFIPGSTWRGAIAELWKYTVGFQHKVTNAFIKDSIFRDAYQQGTIFQPIYFRKEKKTGDTVNLLETYVKEQIFLTNRNQSAVIENWSTHESHVMKSAAIGTKISRTRESVEHGKLYTMTSIAEGTLFETTAQIPEEVVQLIAPKKELVVYIGKKRFSGYGKTRITFEKQVESFQEQAFSALQQYVVSKDHIVVALSATSPVIIYDEFLRPAQQIVWETNIRPFIDDTLGSVKPINETTWATSTVRDGWQQQWNAPKPTEQVLCAGATYIATFEKAYKEKVLQALKEILTQGIGERVQEGFGQFIIAPTQEIMLSQATEVDITYDKQLFNNARDKAFTVDEQSEILQLAEQLFSELTQNISLSQWQMLLNEKNVVDAIISTEQKSYLQRRIASNVRNGWKPTSKKSKDGNGYLLRSYVQQIVSNEIYIKREESAVKLLIKFIARMQRTVENNKKGELV